MGSPDRPPKWGAGNRNEYITQDSEVSLIAINDDNGNPVFLGRSIVGRDLSADKWQIRFIEYDSNQGVTRVTWPQNDEGNASTDYEFVWSSFSALTITNITQDNPALVTVSDIGSLENGDSIIIQGVEGMTEVNFTGSNLYTVANLAGNDFELSGVDSSAYGAYSAGGTVEYGEYANYVYS